MTGNDFGQLGVNVAFLHQALNDEKQDLLKRLETAPKFDDALESDLRTAITEFKEAYVRDNPNVVAK